MIESFVMGFASSFAATLFYELAKKGTIKKKSFENDRYNSQLKEALRKATAFVLSEDIKLNDAQCAIVDAIWEKRTNHGIVTDVDLIVQLSYILGQYDETTVTVDELLAAIIAALPSQIGVFPELSSCITLEMLQQLKNSDELIKVELRSINSSLLKDARSRVDLQKELFALNERIQSSLSARNSMVANNRFLPTAYQEYFVKPLFLEKNMPDKRIATLKDTYIMPKFQILDYPLFNADKIYTDISKFVTDFVDNNLKSHNYGTRYGNPSTDINTLFIKGHPGSGKSSLFYFLAYEKSHNNFFIPGQSVYFVRLVELLEMPKQ